MRLTYRLTGLITLLTLTFLTSSIAHAGTPPPIMVYEDEYVFKEGATDSLTVSEKQLILTKLTNKYNVIKGANSKLKLACPRKLGVQVEAQPSNKIVQYNASKDKCKTDPVPGYLCSPNYVVKMVDSPNDQFFTSGQLWGLNGQFGINAPQAWDYTHGSNNVVVAVIDTGVNVTHSDLAANIWINPNEISGNGVDDDNNGFVDDIRGASMITGGSANDDNGHGTHVAGTICAVGNNGSGVVGVNWNCKILPVKFLDSNGSGSLYNAARGIDYVTALKNRGVPIVLSNNSWSGGGANQVLQDSIQRARDAGILFVAAAGNSGVNTDTSPAYPSSYDLDNIVSVAAIDPSGKLASFSNFGVNSVDIAAPGVGILSTYIPASEYVTLSGTSMAAPHVSGALALLKSKESGLSWNDLKARLLGHGRQLASLQGKVKSGATLDAYQMFLPPSPPPPTPTPVPPCQHNRFKRCTDKCDQMYQGKPNKRKACWKACRVKYNCPAT